MSGKIKLSWGINGKDTGNNENFSFISFQKPQIYSTETLRGLKLEKTNE